MTERGGHPGDRETIGRRGFLARMSGWAMAGGLLSGYGAFAAIIVRYLFPARPATKGWLYVTDLASMKVGDALLFRTPAGARANVARHGATGGAEDFIALSSTCPHLGCQVHWEANNHRFFCPCHNGVFDPSGKATAGPPGDAGQSLPRYPLKVDGGLLFIEVPLEQLALRTEVEGAGPSAPGNPLWVSPAVAGETKEGVSPAVAGEMPEGVP